jgi:hypothetical protein
MTSMNVVRAIYTALSLMLIFALLSGRDDHATNLFISLTSMVIIGLVGYWYRLRDRRDRQQ